MSLFVVGTDTGVGKTVVTAGVTRWLRDDGVDAVAVKPCQTGYPPDDDAAFVRTVCEDQAAATCFRYLEPALAPAVAAREADEELSYDEILESCERAMEAHEAVVVEGIGGLRVALADGREVVDLVSDLGLPVLVVARSGLGTLNHTALTVDALRGRDVPVRGVVLNEYDGASVAERTNPDVVRRQNDVEVATLPTFEDGNRAAAAVPTHLPDGFRGPRNV